MEAQESWRAGVDKNGGREGGREGGFFFTCHERVGVGLPSAVQVKVGETALP